MRLGLPDTKSQQRLPGSAPQRGQVIVLTASRSCSTMFIIPTTPRCPLCQVRAHRGIGAELAGTLSAQVVELTATYPSDQRAPLARREEENGTIGMLGISDPYVGGELHAWACNGGGLADPRER